MASTTPSFLFSLNSIHAISSSKASPSFLPTKPRTKPLSQSLKISSSLNESNPSESSKELSPSDNDDGSSTPDPVRVAFAKALEYKKSKPQNAMSTTTQLAKPEKVSAISGSDEVSSREIPPSVKLAMEKANEYKNKGTNGGGVVEVENKVNPVENLKGKAVQKGVDRKEELSISSIDFVGLEFSEKKRTKGLPAGLVPSVDTFADGDLPEVEIIVGDIGKFGAKSSTQSVPIKEDTDSELYKPKVSTWGVFPRPNNISKTYGGGRTIKPGEVLEAPEDKAAKEARTRKLLSAYKTKIGLTIDPKTKAECEKALNDGDRLMDLGKLQEALPYYEKVMKEVVYQSELHGLAALQWSICQDSLSRPNEAKVMYERLQSHPNVQVSKRARQFIFGFQAMEMMKVSSDAPSATGYQNYFEAFVKERADYSPTKDQNEGSLKEVLPYIAFLVSPIFLILYIAARKAI